MAISPQRLTIYSYSAHRAVIFAIAQLSFLYVSTKLEVFTAFLFSRKSETQDERTDRQTDGWGGTLNAAP